MSSLIEHEASSPSRQRVASTADAVWYSIGVAAAAIIIIALWISSEGKEHPLQQSAASLDEAKAAAAEAMTVREDALDDVRRIQSDMNRMIQETMQRSRNE